MQRSNLYAALTWCALTALVNTATMCLLIKTETLFTAFVVLNTVVALPALLWLLVVYLPKNINAPTVQDMQRKVQQLHISENNLRQANRKLQQQLLMRSILERELNIMRVMQYAHNQKTIEEAAKKIDRICEELRELLPKTDNTLSN